MLLRNFADSRMLSCSIADIIIWFPLFLFAKAYPFIAQLLASEPQLVKNNSFGLQLKSFAIVSLEFGFIAYLAYLM